jgi:regulator of protease activity HflC (stomatin/prohibitin superfamily)
VIEQILKLLESGWDVVSPFTVCAAYERVVILRLGKYHRTLDPGFHLKWPLAEFPIQAVSCMTTERTPPQTLTTADGKNVVVAGIVRFEIKDPRPYVTEVWDQKDVLLDVTMGAIGRHVRAVDWTILPANPPEKEILSDVREHCNRYGFKIHAFTFTDMGRVNSLRLVTDHAANLSN